MLPALMKADKHPTNYVYILRCADDTLYCGWTTDLIARIAAHNSGNGAKYTRSRCPVELAYYPSSMDQRKSGKTIMVINAEQ